MVHLHKFLHNSWMNILLLQKSVWIYSETKLNKKKSCYRKIIHLWDTVYEKFRTN